LRSDGSVNSRGRSISDALSGVESATCSGRAAHDDGSGDILCVVSFMPGVNDVVVEASDQANNSGSAGIWITRTGVSSWLQLEPEAFSLLVGQSKQIQVLDGFHADVEHAVWSVSNPALGTVSDDGRNVGRQAAARVDSLAEFRPAGGRDYTIGGSMLVIESSDGSGSVLARSGSPGIGEPWRYRSPGRFGDWIAKDLAVVTDGATIVIFNVMSGARCGRDTARRCDTCR
jgi:hypothetical protein